MFLGKLAQICDPPLVWSDVSEDCVLSIDAGGTPLPGATDNGMLYLGLGLAALLLLSFAGGRASKRTSRTGRIYSRTTTRTLFA